MRRYPYMALGLAAMSPAPASAQPAQPVATGVYECETPIDIGGMIMASPQTGPMFGVTGPGAYRDFNGGRGTFGIAGNRLTMMTGPLKGTVYLRKNAVQFKPLRNGAEGSISCVLNKRKSLTGRW